VIDESDLQFEKHFNPRISTFFGIKIDRSDEDENVSDSIRVKCELDSKKSDSIPTWLLRTTIDSGIQIRKI
jgi:hypothetical protein